MKNILFSSLFSVGFLLGFIVKGLGQTSTLDQTSFTPLTPNAAELFKYVSTPVDKMTGVPSISFPLYTVNTGKIRLPISLSYHASGIKVDQRATWVGLGWSLNAGGIITREVRGMPDEKEPYGWFQDSSALTNIDSVLNYSGDPGSEWSTMYTWCTGNMQDTHPDFFSYSLPSGKSGRFIYSRTKKMFMPIPYQPVVISHLTTDPDDGYNANLYSIVDDDGTKYLFEAQESFLNDNTNLDTYIQSWYLTRIISSDLKDTVYLNYSSGVLGPSGSEQDLVHNFGVTYSYYGQGNPSPNFPSSDMNGQDSHTSSVIATTHSIKILQSIVFRQGKIEFSANTIRKDCPGGSLDSIVVYSRARDAYIVTNVFKFNYSYFASFNADLDGDSSWLDYRLKLDSFSKQDLAGGAPEQYKFGYSSVVMPPLYSYAADYWGFYNGRRNNITLLPNIVPPVPGIRPQDPLGTAIRNADDDSIMTGMLQKVTYPTGGYTTYSYEPNKFTSTVTSTVTVNVDSGSLYGKAHLRTTSRVDNFSFPNNATSENATFSVIFSPIALNDDIGQVITLTDVTTGVNLYTFTHTGNLTVTQTYSQTVTYDSTHQYQITAQTDDLPTSYIRYSMSVQALDSSSILKSGGGIRIKSFASYNTDGSLQNQTIYKYGQNENGLGWLLMSDETIYESFSQMNFAFIPGGVGGDYCVYSPVGWEMMFNSKGSYASSGFQGASVLYNYVTQYQIDRNGLPNGKILYVYNYPAGVDYTIMSSAGIGNREWIDNSMMEEQLAAQYDYSYDKASMSYAPVQSDVFRYQLFSFGQEQAVNCWVNMQYLPNNYPSCGAVFSEVQNDFGHIYYNLNMGGYRLAKQTHKDYDVNGDSVQTEKDYTYNNTLHLYPNVIRMINSKGDTLTGQVSYPSDQSSTDTNATVLAKMATKNMYDKPFLKQDFKNSTPLRSVRTFFSDQWDPSGNTILPKQQVLSIFDRGIGTISKYNHFDAYDSCANVLQMQNQTGINTSYIYDYWGTYVVAGATNATFADIAYTSFEADGIGNWTLSGGSVDTTQAITGNNSYQGGTITASGLNPATTYIVSYWSENGAYSVSGTISGYPVQGKTISYHTPGWTLYVHKVTGQNTITVNATGHIDELRLYPATAQMTTYTYDPLVGMTSQTDAGNRTTYYEYDGLARLKRIRDQDYNILKTIEYAYQAPAGCGSGCYSIAMQTFAGTGTLSYPVGVFDIHGTLLGNATNAAGYINLWNADTADARVGTLTAGSDSMHFNLALNAGQTLPAAVTGLRYFQVDLPWNQFDAVRQINGAYIDFGDGTGIRMPSDESDTPAIHPPNTVYVPYYEALYGMKNAYYYIHSYADTSLKTITCYHNDTAENSDFDNINSPATSLTKLRNLRGDLPAHTNEIGGSCFQQASMTSLQGISNWSSISSVLYFRMNMGDGINALENVSYPQDFLANDKGLLSIVTMWGNNPGFHAYGNGDPTFKLSRLKSDWNTYFTQLQSINIAERDWNHEDLTALTHLSVFYLVASDADGGTEVGGPYAPLDSTEIDNIFIQIDNGAGKYIRNGQISIATGGSGHTAASQASINDLLNKGWAIGIDGVLQQHQ